MPSFQVVESFALESRSLFVLAGSVASGTIRPGMLVRVPFNDSVAMTAPIDSVEFLRREGGREDTALCIRYVDTEELGLWRGLSIGGETIEIVEAAEGGK